MRMVLTLTANGEASGLVDIILPVVAVAFVVTAAFMLLWRTRARIARSNAERGSPRDRIEQIKARVETTTLADRQTVELLDTAQRLAGQLDAKAAHLELLIEQADARIAVLHGGAVIRESVQPPAAAALSEVMGESPDDPSADLDPMTADVHRLADEGFTSVQIARELDETTGKVELILALRGHR